MGFDLDSIPISNFESISQNGNKISISSRRSKLSNNNTQNDSRKYAKLFWKQSISHETENSETITTGCVAIFHVPSDEENETYEINTSSTSPLPIQEYSTKSGRLVKRVKYGAGNTAEASHSVHDSESYSSEDSNSNNNDSDDLDDMEDSYSEISIEVTKRTSTSEREVRKSTRKRKTYDDSDSDFSISRRYSQRARRGSTNYASTDDSPIEQFAYQRYLAFDFDPKWSKELTLSFDNEEVMITDIGKNISRLYECKVDDRIISINQHPVETLTRKQILEYVQGKRTAGSPLSLMVKGERMTQIKKLRQLMKKDIIPNRLYEVVESLGGPQVVANTPLWQTVRKKLNLLKSTSSGNALKKAYEVYFGEIVGMTRQNASSIYHSVA